MSVGEFVAGVDQLLSRAHGLFAATGGGEVATGGWAGGSVPAAPSGGSGLGTGVTTAGGVYDQSRAGLAGLDAELGLAAAEGGAVAEQGRAGSGAIRDQARTVATATAPMGNSAAGARLIVAAMDQQLAAMQRQMETTSAHNHRLALALRQVAEGYRGLAPGDVKGTPPAAPLDSHTWKPGDQRHMPYIAGRDGLGPPNPADAPPWVEIGPRSGNFVRSDELPGLVRQEPSLPGPATRYDDHGNPDPYISLGPNTGAWAPKSDFPGAKIYTPGSTELPPYGWEEWMPGSGIFMWHGDLVPEPYNAYGPLGPPTQTYPQGGH